MTSYDCMTPDELALWRTARPRAGGRTPCVDCPLWFARQMRAKGCCNGKPGRPRLPAVSVDRHGRGYPYATEEERSAARRLTWRLSKKRQRLARSTDG